MTGLPLPAGRLALALSRRLYRPPQPRTCILCYHTVERGRGWRNPSPELFEDHLRWLKDNCELVPLQRAIDWQGASGGPRVSITFDDGHAGNHEFAFPLLEKHGAPATLFVTSGFADRAPAVVEKFRRSGWDADPLSWKQVEEIAAAGFEIGAHTVSHPNLAILPPEEQRSEILGCRERLEGRLGREVKGFAYPYGNPRCHFNQVTARLVREAGYSYAVSTMHRGLRRRDSVWAVPRILVAADELEHLADKVRGTFDLLGRFWEWAPAGVARRVSPRAFRTDL